MDLCFCKVSRLYQIYKAAPLNIGKVVFNFIKNFIFNKLQKLEDALLKHMLTAADLATEVTWVTWLTGRHE